MCLISLFLLIGQAPAQASPPEQLIKQLLDRLLTSETARVRDEKVSNTTELAEFYADRGFAPVWRDPLRLDAVVGQINAANDHGLLPAHYHADALQGKANGWNPEVEILATDGLAQLTRDLHFGRVDPVSLDPRWNVAGPTDHKYGFKHLKDLSTANDLASAVRALAPNHFFYQGLMDVLAQYRGLAETRTFTPVPAGIVLKQGMTDPRIAILRQRLEITDSAGRPVEGNPSFYDTALVSAVERFQTRHGLDPDGVVGPATLSALNTSFAERVEQIRVNLERARWVLRDLGNDFLIVNIAGFNVFLIRNKSPVWSSRVIVGRPYRKTPVFRAEVSYLVLNPTWTVPPTILRKDKLPLIAKDPLYLERSNMVVRDRNGQHVDPAGIDWAHHATRGGFPYQIVQRPGPNNALGHIKFMFPNDYFVYLHDTPNRELFEKSVRTFSSGCIRLENPLELAEHLLADPMSWSRSALDDAIATGITRNVGLKTKIPIIIMYWTVQPSPAVGVRFFADVYERDAAVLSALNAAR